MKIKGETYARRKFANYACSYGRFDVLHEPQPKETTHQTDGSLNKLQKGNEVITIGGLKFPNPTKMMQKQEKYLKEFLW